MEIVICSCLSIELWRYGQPLCHSPFLPFQARDVACRPVHVHVHVHAKPCVLKCCSLGMNNSAKKDCNVRVEDIRSWHGGGVVLSFVRVVAMSRTVAVVCPFLRVPSGRWVPMLQRVSVNFSVSSGSWKWLVKVIICIESRRQGRGTGQSSTYQQGANQNELLRRLMTPAHTL